MKTFVNLLKVLAIATLVTSCAYEKDPGLLPKVITQDNKDTLLNKPSSEVVKTKYKTLAAVCKLEVKAPATTPPDVTPAPGDSNPPVATPEPGQPAPAPGDSGPAPAPGDSSPAPAPAPGDTGPAPAPAPGDTGLIAAITEGTPAAPPAEQQADAPVVTPPKDAAVDTVTVNFVAQLKVDAELKNPIKDAVMVLATGTNDEKLSVNLTVNPLVFKDNETLANGTSVYVMKHSPRMAASAVIAKVDKDGKEIASETMPVNVIEGITSKIESDKVGATVSCDLNGTIDEANELMKGQWLKVDCAADESTITDKAAKEVYRTSCKDKKPNLPQDPPPPTQGGSPFPPK